MDPFDFHFASAAAFIYTLVKWLLMALLLAASTIWNRARFAISLVMGLVVACAGMLFKLMHWTFARELLLLGAALFSGSYIRWFRAKPGLASLDYLKLLWMLGAVSVIAVMAMYPSLVRPVAGVTEALFWAMALLFVYQRWIRRPGTVE